MVKRYQSGHTVEVDMCTCSSNSSGTNGIVTTRKEEISTGSGCNKKAKKGNGRFSILIGQRQ
jgi:hypothetical protein